MKSYNSAPLPFQGQKRNFVKEFKKGLSTFQNVNVIVDLFGGSGLLSQAAKEVFPGARVVYNDYDNFTKRLANIEKTNRILDDIREIVGDYASKKRMTEDLKAKIIQRLENEQGYVDYITLSSSVLFSGHYSSNLEELKKENFYRNSHLKTPKSSV